MNPDAFSVMPARVGRDTERMRDFLNNYVRERQDPASKAPGAAPLWGGQAMPHVLTYQSLIGTFSKAYLNPDEAYQDSIDNAHSMLRDVGILECLDNRRRHTSLLDWEIEPEDKDCRFQRSLALSLTRIVKRIRRFSEYRFWLSNALWHGRAGIQHRYGYVNVNGRSRLMPKPLHRDHLGWMPINGDKLVFRYDDGRLNRKQGEYAHQCGIRVSHLFGQRPGLGRESRITPVGDGLAIFLRPWERDTLTIHKHYIEDADYHHSHFSGSVHGVGIRSKIYWEWWLKQEAFAFLMQYLERSAGGTEIYFYPAGDEDAKKKMQQAHSEKSANGKNAIFFPRPMGEDGSLYDYQVVEPGAVGMDTIKEIVDKYFGGRIKRYILGQVLTTEAEATGLGSGVADAHLDTLQQIVMYDARNLEETLTEELVRYIQLINWPETAQWHMRFKLKTDDDDAKERLEAMQMAYEMGARIPEKQVLDVIGLGLPQDGENVLNQSDQFGAGIPGMGMPTQDGDGDGRTGAAELADDDWQVAEMQTLAAGEQPPEQYSARQRAGIIKDGKFRKILSTTRSRKAVS